MLDFEYFGNETRYDVKVFHTYSKKFALLKREFIWVDNRCRCPHLKISHEYIVMGGLGLGPKGRNVRLEMTDGSFIKAFSESVDDKLRTLAEKSSC